MQLITRLRREDGFTMITVMGAMFVVMLLSVAALAAANGDVRLTRYDQDDKQSYAAAEAGVNDYLGHLNVDNSYWAKCTNVSAPTPVNQINTSTKRRTLPDSNSEYWIELIPAPGKTACDPNDATASMVSDGNIKVRVTGHVLGTNNYRTINATFRRSGFLDYLYYTDYENQSPAYFARSAYSQIETRSTDSAGRPTTPNVPVRDWVPGACDDYYYASGSKPGRANNSWTGQYVTGTNSDGSKKWSSNITIDPSFVCSDINFVTGDSLNGPFHSNDDILVCGSPSFGTSGGNDRVEVSGPGENNKGYRDCGNSSPTFNPALVNNVNTLKPPVTNDALASVADDAYVFSGAKKLVLNGSTMTVSNMDGSSSQTLAWPTSGVVYFKSGPAACSASYDPTNSEAYKASGNSCGDVDVSGSYSKDLTIGADNDVIFTANTVRSTGSDALLGIIPNGFARVAHPPAHCNDSNASTPKNVKIDGAILALNGSFTVDNYWCGNSLGTLSVTGAIAQTHRGTVGTSGGSGYLKNYSYNNALRYRSPPHFLDPLQSPWRILRQGEQSPPQKG